MAHVSAVADGGATWIPDEVLDKLGIEPASVLEWEIDGDHAVVRKVKPLTIDEVHRDLFPDGPPPARTVEEMDEAVARGIREKYGRRG